MWTLIIYFISAKNSQLAKVEVTAAQGFEWEHHGNGTWEFNALDGSWSGMFTKVQEFTETRSDGEDEDQETTAPVTLGARATGGSSRRPAHEAEGQHDPTV